MKLNLRFLYLIPLIYLIGTDQAINAFAFGKEDEAGLGQYYVLGLNALSVLFVLRYYRYLEPVMRMWFFVVIGYMMFLSLESYGIWGSWMKYPHVLSKLLKLLPIFGIYAFYRRYPEPPYRLLVAVLFPTMLVTLVVFFPEALSLGSFLETERGFSVVSAYLILFFGLFCLNWYISRNSFVCGLTFLLCVVLIIFLQHRTVWVCMALAVSINILLLIFRVPEVRAIGQRMMVLGGLGLALGLTSGMAVVLDNPDVLKKLAKSIADIQNPTTQGTGTFRMMQYESYMPLVEQRPLAGWRLKGFEVPIQFYSPDSGEPYWPDYTGHHFHSLYLDRLFYFGIIGVLMLLLLPIVVIGKRLLQTSQLSVETAALLAFTATSPVFGLSYDWPIYMYGVIGLVLAITAPMPAPAALPTAPQVRQRELPARPKPVLAY
jgi:hypothetical protein